MARIAGVNIPNNAHIVIGLQAIYGIGATRAKSLCETAGIQGNTKVKDLDETQLEALREQIAKYEVEGDLRREVTRSSKRLMDMGCIAACVTVVVYHVAVSALVPMHVPVKVRVKRLLVRNNF